MFIDDPNKLFSDASYFTSIMGVGESSFIYEFSFGSLLGFCLSFPGVSSSQKHLR